MTIPVWLLIALPLAGAAILLLSGRWSDPWGHLLGCATSLGVLRRRRGAVRRHARPGRRGTGRSREAVLLGAGRRTAGGLRPATGPAVHVLRAADHRRRLADPHLLGRLHGRRPGPPKVFRVSEPVPLGDAAAGACRQLPGPLRRLGRRRPGVLPADRVLAAQAVGRHRRQEGVRRQPRRRHRPCHRADGDVRLHRLDLVRGRLRGRTASWARARSTPSACCCCSPPAASPRRCRCSPGSATRWRAPPRSPRSSTPPRW